MSDEVMTWESACMARNKGIVCDASCEACLIEAELSALAEARAEGIREGMLIRRVGKENVTDVEGFKKALESQPKDEGVLMLVRTPQGNRFVVIERK